MENEKFVEATLIEGESVVSQKMMLPKIFDLLKNAINLYKQKFRKIISMLLFVFLGALPIFIVYGLYALSGSLMASSTALNIINLILGLVGILGIFFYIYFIFSAQIGILLSLTSQPEEKSKEIFKRAKKYFWPYLLVTLATTVFVILWSMLFIIPGIIMAIYYNFSILAFVALTVFILVLKSAILFSKQNLRL